MATFEDKRKFQNIQNNLEQSKNKLVKLLHSILNHLEGTFLIQVEHTPPPQRLDRVKHLRYQKVS